jgi:hypothetical protein
MCREKECGWFRAFYLFDAETHVYWHGEDTAEPADQAEAKSVLLLNEYYQAIVDGLFRAGLRRQWPKLVHVGEDCPEEQVEESAEEEEKKCRCFPMEEIPGARSKIMDLIWIQPMDLPVRGSDSFTIPIVVKGAYKFQFSDHVGKCEEHPKIGKRISPGQFEEGR